MTGAPAWDRRRIKERSQSALCGIVPLATYRYRGRESALGGLEVGGVVKPQSCAVGHSANPLVMVRCPETRNVRL
jgi:hypothetical protein